MLSFLVIYVYLQHPHWGFVNYRGWVRSDLHMCGGEGRFLLLLILAGSFPGLMGGPNSGRGVKSGFRY